MLELNTLYSILLGALQGASEFLPISSSGHLQLVKAILGLAEIPILYDVLLHIATLLVIVFMMRRPLGELFQSAFSKGEDHKSHRNILYAILIGLIPTAIIGVVIDQLLLPLPLFWVGISFFLTATVLFGSKYATVRHTTISFNHAVLIGIIHGCTVLPGISRAGTTIAVILLLGYGNRTAITVSFISAIPVMLGALILKLRDFASLQSMLTPFQIIIGCVTAVVVGFLSYTALKILVERQKLQYFSIYLAVIGSATILFALL